MSLDTTRGYPFPEGTDPVSQLTVILAALAQAIDSQLGAMASGEATINITALNTPISLDVDFPVGRFSVAPKVVASFRASSPNQLQGPNVTAITATGFRLWVNRTGGATGNVDVHWIAREGD